MALGEKLRNTRENVLNIAAVDMAGRLGISQTTVSFIETGRRRAPKKLLEPIAREYGLALEEVKSMWIADEFAEEGDDEITEEILSPSNIFPLLEIIVRKQINPLTKSDLDALVRTQNLLPKAMSEDFILLFLHHRKS
jgi:transcriptional regulator with XRE-family HTH domain